MKRKERKELSKVAKILYTKVKYRLKRIIEILTERDASCIELAEELDVSKRTIKRDIRYLRKLGYVIRVYGEHDKKYKLIEKGRDI